VHIKIEKPLVPSEQAYKSKIDLNKNLSGQIHFAEAWDTEAPKLPKTPDFRLCGNDKCLTRLFHA